MDLTEEEYLEHYGTPRHSGRYPYGSGGDDDGSLRRNPTILDQIAKLKSQGMTDPQIAEGLGMTTTQLRAQRSIALNSQRKAEIAQIQRLKAKGMSNVEIGKRLDMPEATVRSRQKEALKDRENILDNVSNMLEQNVQQKGYIDIGSGVENQLGISSTRLATAVEVLKSKGYVVEKVQVDQGVSANKTTVKVLAPPGTTYRDIATNKDKIRTIVDFSEDGGRTMLGIDPPLPVSAKRLAIRYKEQGGDEADGVVYVRPGVDDLSLGKARYAQVRVAVGESGAGTHYIKGMAVYKDDLPPGVDLMFNTNKSDTGNKLDALKKQSDDPENPFGSAVRQIYKTDANGKQVRDLGLASAMNIVNEEGQWGGNAEHKGWSNNLSSQFLSKQSSTLARAQLDMTFERRKNQLEEILSLTNPAVRQHLLKDFSEDVDAAAVHLKAAALPRQATNVILPVNSLKKSEIYAPGFRNGERVVLVRFPHGGTFEIPELTVNNNNPEAKKLLGTKPRSTDAVGIHHEVAKRLSGADFDGDTVLVIPQRDSAGIKTKAPLEKLKDFDAQRDYKLPDDAPKLSSDRKQQLMGDVSNLITDMTIKGATDNELAAAVRHSMVVIDAEKHHLDYKRSAIEHGIPNLKRKYQGSARSGASTIVSRKKSTELVPERKRAYRIDPDTGARVPIETGAFYINKDTGVRVDKKTKVVKLAETSDAHSLSSGTPIERVYADHSNRLKDLANTARREQVNTKTIPYRPDAAKAYHKEVSSLDEKLNVALMNSPRERQARLLAASTVSMKRAQNPDMDKAELKKLNKLALEEARARTGAHKEQIEITRDEWDAIQSGAISHHKLSQILKNSNIEVVKTLATPKKPRLITSAKAARAKQMLASGYTQAEVADALGVSLTTLKTSIK